MAENIQLQRPAAGQNLVVPVAPDAHLEFTFDQGDANFSKDGQNFVLTFNDGGTLTLQGFYDNFGDNAQPPTFVTSGGELPGEQFLAALDNPDLMPLAGPTAGPAVLGGGAYEDALLAGVGGVTGLDKLGFDGWARGTEYSFVYQPPVAAATTGALTANGPAPEISVSLIPDNPNDYGIGMEGGRFQFNEAYMQFLNSTGGLIKGSLVGTAGAPDPAAAMSGDMHFTITTNAGLGSILIGGKSYDIDPVTGKLIMTPLLSGDGSVQITGGAVAQNPDGTYTLTLQVDFDHNHLHDDGLNPQSEPVFDFTVGATTSGGLASSMVNTGIDVLDDAPELRNLEYNLSFQNGGNEHFHGVLAQFGADGPSTSDSIVFTTDLDKVQCNWLYDGKPVTLEYGDDHSTILGMSSDGLTTVFTLTLAVDQATDKGEYKLTWQVPLDTVSTHTDLVGSGTLDKGWPGDHTGGVWIGVGADGGILTTVPTSGVWAIKIEAYANGYEVNVNSNNPTFGGTGGKIGTGATEYMLVTPHTDLDNGIYATSLVIGIAENNGHDPIQNSTTATVTYISLSDGSSLTETFPNSNAADLRSIVIPEQGGYYIASVKVTTTDDHVGLTGGIAYQTVTGPYDLDSLPLTYQVTDGDGDSVTGALTLTPENNINPNIPIMASSAFLGDPDLLNGDPDLPNLMALAGVLANSPGDGDPKQPSGPAAAEGDAHHHGEHHQPDAAPAHPGNHEHEAAQIGGHGQPHGMETPGGEQHHHAGTPAPDAAPHQPPQGTEPAGGEQHHHHQADSLPLLNGHHGDELESLLTHAEHLRHDHHGPQHTDVGVLDHDDIIPPQEPLEQALDQAVWKGCDDEHPQPPAAGHHSGLHLDDVQASLHGHGHMMEHGLGAHHHAMASVDVPPQEYHHEFEDELAKHMIKHTHG